MRTFVSSLLIAALGTCGPALGQDGEAPRGPLREVGMAGEATTYALDRQGEVTGKVVTWQWLVFPEPVASIHGELDALAVRTEVDCDAGTLRPVAFEAYRDGRLIGAQSVAGFDLVKPDNASAEAGVITTTCSRFDSTAEWADIGLVKPWTWGDWVPLEMDGMTLFDGGPPAVVMVAEGTISRPSEGHVFAVLLTSNGSIAMPATAAFDFDCRARTYVRHGSWSLLGDELGIRLGGRPEPVMPFEEARWAGQAAVTLCAASALSGDLPRHPTLRDAQIAGGMGQLVRDAYEGR